ncbi:MAG: hypothetical protein M3220_02365 [Chloroflexota bacterium]|nr:hypothetical protein [Chloroflexota bacterium]
MQYLMKAVSWLPPLFLTLCLTLLATEAQAQEPNRAGLVIQYGDGRFETACVSFTEPEISGFDLLQRSGLPMTYDAQGGVKVCSIGGEGCIFPADSCFCQCEGMGPCVYWSYHQLEADGSWQYSQVGAGASTVGPGEVDGWRWDEGGPNTAPPPPNVSFESICAASEPTPPPPTLILTPTTPPPTPTPIPTGPPATERPAPTVAVTETTPTALSRATEQSEASPAPMPTATIAPTQTREPSNTPEPTATIERTPLETAQPALALADPPETEPTSEPSARNTSPLLNYLIFGALVILLSGGILWARKH